MTLPTKALAIVFLALVAPALHAADQTVPLPYTSPDKDGNTWMVHFYGYLQQQGNMPVYSNAGVLSINGTNSSGRVVQRQVKIDGKTGELILENLQMGTVNVTRRFQFNKDEGYVRIIDVLKNTQNRDMPVQLALNANVNYGIQSAQTIADPKKKNQNYAWVGTTSANNKAVVEIFNGINIKTPFSIDYQPGNSQVVGNLSTTIPANKEIAIMHIHAVANSAAEGQDLVKKFKESKALKDVAPSLRKLIVNFNAGSAFYGDYEILRGDLFDVVEMRTGDQFRGNLKDASYKIDTFYGPVTIPAEKVLCVISLGAVRPRQLLFTIDGDVIGGKLEKDKVALELSDGQTMEIPLAGIARVGYRKRAGEVEDPILDKPFVLMRTGERIAIQMPTAPITVHTRFGPMNLQPASLTALVFQNEEHAVHEVRMTDGTRLAALVDSVQLEAKLASSDQTIKFPLISAARLQLKPETPESDEPAPQLRLTNEELMVGTLAGKLKLDTGFSLLTLDADGIKTLTRVKESPQDVQVSLWDETSFRGQLQEPEVTCITKGGLEVKVPIALIEEYTQPAPKPSGAIVTKIKELVTELNADDWSARQKAQEKLSGMGPIAASVLRDLRSAQPEEAQSRIDQILGALDKKK
ncbi:MAG: hypothetical protein JWN40_158 [Phycisphaerales bacterium]|nr:hypothetical protein [Phycisphaerales bacterium]